jgi:integrase/recombinase XerD
MGYRQLTSERRPPGLGALFPDLDLWRDLQEREEGELATGHTGQVTAFGKGSKTRVILLSAGVWRELVALRGDAGPDEPVFRSRKKGGHLDRSQVLRLV